MIKMLKLLSDNEFKLSVMLTLVEKVDNMHEQMRHFIRDMETIRTEQKCYR